MSSEFEKFVTERKLIRVRISKGMILKEIEAAQTDLKDAQDSLDQKKFKWATIKDIIPCFTVLGRYFIFEVLGRRAIMRCW